MSPVGGKEIKKFVGMLFKLRSEIKKMMSISGTHNNDPMYYVDRAKQRVPGGGVCHCLSLLYYFYVKCEENTHVNDEFTIGMPDDLKGTSTCTMVPELDAADALSAHTVASRVQKRN
jgi:hypothetical protein